MFGSGVTVFLRILDQQCCSTAGSYPVTVFQFVRSPGVPGFSGYPHNGRSAAQPCDMTRVHVSATTAAAGRVRRRVVQTISRNPGGQPGRFSPASTSVRLTVRSTFRNVFAVFPYRGRVRPSGRFRPVVHRSDRPDRGASARVRQVQYPPLHRTDRSASAQVGVVPGSLGSPSPESIPFGRVGCVPPPDSCPYPGHRGYVIGSTSVL